MTIKKLKELDSMVALAINRIDAIEVTQTDVVKRLGSLELVVNELKEVNNHLRDIAAAMRVLLAVGRGIKWLAGMVASLAAMWYSIRQWIM